MEPPSPGSGHNHLYLYRLQTVGLNGSTSQVFVDDDSEVLVLVDSEGAYSTVPIQHSQDSSVETPISPCTLDYVSSKPCLGARLSLHRKFLAIQRSLTGVEVVVLGDPSRSTFHQCRTNKKDNILLGFLWGGTPYCELLLVATQGLEMLKELGPHGQMKLGKTIDIKCNWYKYSPDAALLLVSTGSKANMIQGYQLTEKDFTKFKQFEIDIGNQTVLEEKDLLVAKLYDRMMAIHFDRARKRLVLFELHPKKGGEKKYVINLHSNDHVSLSMVDNLVVVHNMESQVTMLFDINSSVSNFPVTAPLPLTFDRGDEPSSELYSESWRFVGLRFVYDTATSLFWELRLDMEKIVQSTSADAHRLIDFLLRRTESKGTILKVLRRFVEGRTGLLLISRIFLLLNGVLHDAVVEAQKAQEEKPKKSSFFTWGDSKKGDGLSIHSPFRAALAEGVRNLAVSTRGHLPPSEDVSRVSPVWRYVDGCTVIEQEDVYSAVFTGGGTKGVSMMDPAYMIGVLAEYIRTLNHYRLIITPAVMHFLVHLLSSSGRFYQLHQFIQYKVVHDSEAVADQLLGMQAEHGAAFQLAIDMLQRLGAHERIVDLLLHAGQVLPALLFTRRYNLKNLPVERFLKAALTCGDEVVMFTVFRYFRNQREYDELLPQFQQAMMQFQPSA